MSRVLTIIETQQSRKFSFDATSAKGTWEYVVLTEPTTNNEVAVKAAALAASPPAWILTGVTAQIPYQSLYRSSVDATPVGGGVWNVTVSYDRPAGSKDNDADEPADADDLDPGISFDLRGEPRHVTQSLLTYSRTGASGSVARDYQGAIGVGPDGKAEGVDVLTPALEFTVTRTFLSADVTHGYLKTIGKLVGRVNDAAWWAYQANEVRFMGASGAAQKDGSFSISYKFAVSFNETSLYICPSITVPSKPGWAYLWVAYKPGTDASGRLVDVPAAAYVEQVFKQGDFTQLGLG